MKNKVNVYRYINFIQYLLTSIYVLVFLRFIVLSVSDEFLQGYDVFSQYFRYIELIIVNITNPLTYPFVNLIQVILKNSDTAFLEIVTPIGVILIVLFLKVTLKIITPYLNYFFNK